jgi:phosphate-selective porin OprO and OprP
MTKKTLLLFWVLFSISFASRSQNINDLINVLVQNRSISQSDADSIRADDALKQQANKGKQKLFPLNANRALQISGYTQIRYQSFQKSTVNDGFDVRRTRIDISGSLDPKFDYRVQADFGGTAFALIDAYAVYKPCSYTKFTVGQFVVPFSLENITSDRNAEIIERSQVVNALVSRKGDATNNLIDSIGNNNGRDIGIQLSGSAFKIGERKLVDYYVGLFDGAGINVGDNNKNKDVAARAVLHPLSFLDLGGSYYSGYDKFTKGYSGDRSRWGAELALSYKAIALKSEFIQGQDANKTAKHINHEGAYVQASYYFVPKKIQGVVKVDTYDPNTDKAGDDETYYIFGVNYSFNSWARLQLNYRQTSGPSRNLISTQLTVGF